jgi:hypothetical protein
MEAESTAIAVGTSALTGWRRPVGRAVARPIASHTRFTQEQVEAALGIAVLAWAVYRLAGPIVRGLNR